MHELDPKALEELAVRVNEYFGKELDPKKFAQDFLVGQREQEEWRKRHEKFVLEFDRHQFSLLDSYKGKKLEISTAFYDTQ